MDFSRQLRTALVASHKRYAKDRGIPIRRETDSAIIFGRTEAGHGNFHPESFREILANPGWAGRFDKKHTHFGGEDVRELDSCQSSDALLMNIFCHPGMASWKGPRDVLGLDRWETPQFGWKPPLANENPNRTTECDMRIGNTIFEAKLTEGDFQIQSPDVVRGYAHADELLSLEALTNREGKVENYQLIRNIVAANEYGLRFVLLADARRPDLIRRLMDTLTALRDHDLRRRCTFVTWQEVVDALGGELREFLALKYGYA
jgi:hypothetical protein